MRLLADENISNCICEYLRTINIDIININNIMKGAPDNSVINFAIKEQRALLTADGDFCKNYRWLKHYGIIWLHTPSKHQLEVICKAISKLQNMDMACKVIKLKKDNYSIIYKRKHYLPETTKTYSY